MPAGRKSKYNPGMIPAVEMWARDGLTEEEIARKLGVGHTAFNVWKNKHAEFVEALKTSKETADARVEKALYTKALDGDTTAQIFWLKNRQPGKWRDKHEIENTGKILVRIGFDDDGE